LGKALKAPLFPPFSNLRASKSDFSVFVNKSKSRNPLCNSDSSLGESCSLLQLEAPFLQQFFNRRRDRWRMTVPVGFLGSQANALLGQNPGFLSVNDKRDN